MEALSRALKMGLGNKLCHLNVSSPGTITDRELNSAVSKFVMPITASRVYNSSFGGIDLGRRSQAYHLIFTMSDSPLSVSSSSHNSANNTLA